MTATATPAPPASPIRTPGRPGAPALLLGQVRHALLDFLRTPVFAFFTLLFPLSFLVIISAIYGNEVVDPETGLRLAQYTTPVFAVFGATMACYMALGSSLAYARATGVVKRLRGTPLPTSLHLAGRVLGSILVAAAAVGLMVGVGVLFYDVQVIQANVPALVLTFLVGTGCFAALGLAVAAVAPTPNAANAFTNASLILLSFISGVFAFGAIPDWLDRIAALFPLEPFAQSFSDGFNPALDASTPDWGNLATMAAWGLAGAIIAWRAMDWEPTPGLVGRGRKARVAATESPADDGAPAGEAPAAPTTVRLSGVVTEVGSPGVPALLRGQVATALRQLARDPMGLFFAVAFPVLLVTFFSAMYGEEAEWGGLPLAQYLAAAFAVYGVATSAFLNLAVGLGEQRGRRTLKRLRGTPLPSWALLAGRILAGLVVGLGTVALVFLVATALFDVTLPPTTWAATVLTYALAIVCFAACGLALVALVDGPQAVLAVSLAILLPLSFVSDIFIAVDEMPAVLDAIGWAFPLRHAVAAAVTATSGGALDATFWGHLGVLVLWTVGTALVAVRWFRWEPRTRG